MEKFESKDGRIECEFIGNEDISKYPEYIAKCSDKEQIEKISKNKDVRKTILKKFYDKHLFRLSLKCKLNDKSSKIITIILMNPSYADYYGLDDTISNVKKFIEKINEKNNSRFQYSQFEVLNIFPIRMANSDCLPCLLEKYDSKNEYREKNIDYILKKIKQGGDFILAWGADYHKEDETKQILEKLKEQKDKNRDNINIFVYHLNTSNGRKGTPSHFNSRVYNKLNKNNKLKLIEVNIIEPKDKLLLLEEKDIKIEL